MPPLKTLDYSAIVAIVRVDDITASARSKWFNKAPKGESPTYGWVLKDVRQLKKPISCKGQLGLWGVPPAILRKIKRQFPRLSLG